MKSVFSVEAILQRSLLKQGQSNPRNTVVPSENYRLVQSRGRKQSNFCDVPFLLTWSCQNLKIIKKNHGQLSTLILSNPFFIYCSKWLRLTQCFGYGSGWIRIIWPVPDPLQETLIRIRVAKKIVINSHTNRPKL